MVSVAHLAALTKTTVRDNRIVSISTTVFDVRTSNPVQAKLAPITLAIIVPVAEEQVRHNPLRTVITGKISAYPVVIAQDARISDNV